MCRRNSVHARDDQSLPRVSFSGWDGTQPDRRLAEGCRHKPLAEQMRSHVILRDVAVEVYLVRLPRDLPASLDFRSWRSSLTPRRAAGMCRAHVAHRRARRGLLCLPPCMRDLRAASRVTFSNEGLLDVRQGMWVRMGCLRMWEWSTAAGFFLIRELCIEGEVRLWHPSPGDLRHLPRRRLATAGTSSTEAGING